jgi:hypothetical protein
MPQCCKPTQPKKVQPVRVAPKRVEPSRAKAPTSARSRALSATATRKATEAAMKVVAAQRKAKTRCGAC